MPTPPVPHLTHPDVEIVKGRLRQLAPGETISYQEVGRLLGYDCQGKPGYCRCQTARRQLLSEEKISIVPIPGEGFVRETAEYVLTRVQGRERRGVHRRSRKTGLALASVANEVAKMDRGQQAEYFAERTIQNILYMATQQQTQRKMLAAAKVSRDTLPMTKALEVLQNGEKQG